MSLRPNKDHYKLNYIEVLGARTHNLKNIDLRFPRNQLVVLTGVSGSGKSSLAFDTIYAEGQRRYRESFNAYARSFLGSITRPEVDSINGLSPVIAIEQKTTNNDPRSTVGTVTEIYDFMRVLFARVADAYDTLEPNLFSFNTPYGACPTCAGLGKIPQGEIDIFIPDKTRSIYQGGILPLGPYKSSRLFKKITAVLKFYHYSITEPVEKLPLPILNLLLFGNVVQSSIRTVASYTEPFAGIIPMLIKGQERGNRSKGSTETTFEMVCPGCAGSRLNKIARSFKIQAHTIAELASMDLDKLQKWFTQLLGRLTKRKQLIAHGVIEEITNRLQFLIDVGLHYLHLNRSFRTLSGGEAQRVKLATQIGIPLLGVCYILDEPSIGLHQRDNSRLITALKMLRDRGNTILVVEHDREMMLAADYLIEIGPKAGIYGGEIVAAGRLPAFLAQDSITAAFLTRKRDFRLPPACKQGNGQSITLVGCSGHNLKNITVTIPLGLMVCVTGVSGSGKSSLIRKTLLPLLQKKLYNSQGTPLACTQAIGLAHISKVIEVNQSPLDRTPRSNPATYTGIFTEIRNFFARLPEAQIRGYKPRRFSFNLKEGRCYFCEGAGIQRIEMGLLPEVYVVCDLCRGKRYNRETLEVHYKGKSIADVLDMTVEDALDFFKSHPTICLKLHTLAQVGLGYLTLGQHATTLSGGEAQRVKLATELAQKSNGNTLYILDEPTTGLHFQDILALLSLLKKLVDQGNTVLVIEHNLDIIKMADYIIDMGPEGGQAGGHIVAVGTPQNVALVPGSHTGYFLKKELELNINIS